MTCVAPRTIWVPFHRWLRVRTVAARPSRSQPPGRRPRGRDVGAALLRDAHAHLCVRGVRRYPARNECLPVRNDVAPATRPGGTLFRRCVEVSRYSLYLRPSAAICTTVSVESRPTSSRGCAEQMLCASSTTTRQGSRECRDRHSVDRTAWATSRCSAAVPSDPRSTTVHRAVGSRSSATSEGCCGSQMLQSNKPMLRARKAQRPSPREVGISKLPDVDDQWFAMLLEAQQLAECGVLLSVADGVQAEDGRRGGWVQVREPQPQPQPQRSASGPSRHTATSFVTRA